MGVFGRKSIILRIAEDSQNYLSLCVSYASFLMAIMICPLLPSYLRFPFPHLFFLFHMQILLKLQTTTHLHNSLHSLPCQAPVQSQVNIGAVLISAAHQIYLSPLPPSWHVMEAQFMCGPLAGGKVHVISSGQKFINDSRLSVSLVLWDLPAPLFSLWYNDQQCSKWMDLQSTCKISRK